MAQALNGMVGRGAWGIASHASQVPLWELIPVLDKNGSFLVYPSLCLREEPVLLCGRIARL